MTYFKVLSQHSPQKICLDSS